MPIEILMPALSPTMEEGTLSKWLVKEGDTVNSGDLLAEIETDKATMEVEAVEEGTVAKLLVAAGSEGVKVNGGSAPAAQPTPVPPAQAGVSSNESASPAAGDPRSNGGEHNNKGSDGNRIKASPLAKRLAAEAGLDLASLSGSGPNGRIIKADVEAAKLSPAKAGASQTGSAQPAPQAAAPVTSTEVGAVRSGGADYLAKLGVEAGSYDLVPLNGIQKVVAKRLADSNNNVPDFPLTIDCEIDELLKMRKELNGQAPEGVKVSVNDMVIRASALALKHVPEANASFTPDGVAMHKNADIAVAVAIDGGLITPIVRHAENKGLSTISSEMKDLMML